MICPDCKAAAAHMRQGDTPGAAALHAFCPGGTWCDCQHATGEHVNRALIPLIQLETRRDVRP